MLIETELAIVRPTINSRQDQRRVLGDALKNLGPVGDRRTKLLVSVQETDQDRTRFSGEC